jgi:predicted RNA-binding protein YlqC (UPF0109 family)
MASQKLLADNWEAIVIVSFNSKSKRMNIEVRLGCPDNGRLIKFSGEMNKREE